MRPPLAPIVLHASSSASRPRAQITTAAPSAASSSATARPRPLLPAATSATRFEMPKSTLFPQVIVGFVQPVLTRRAENVDVERVFQRHGLVPHHRRQVQNFTSAKDDFLRLVFTDPEMQRAFQD